MRIAFTGSRSWHDYDTIYFALEGLKDIYGDELVVCHGDSPGGGADALVAQAADALKVTCIPFPIDEQFDGAFWRTQPLNRNTRMLNDFKPERLIAFRAEGKSNGTDDTIKKARMLNIPVTKYDENPINE